LEGVQGLQGLVSAADAATRIALFSCVPQLLEACGDKQKTVRDAASALVTDLYEGAPAWSGGFVLPLLKSGLSSAVKPEIQVVACKMVSSFAEKFPESLALEIEWLVHPLSILMNALKATVKAAAKDAMIRVAGCTLNRDLEKFCATIVKALESAKNVQGCVEELAGCIFVQNVECPAVAILTPVLVLA